jgi:hypothetical protein
MTEPAKQELKLPQGVTEQQLTQWKRQHGKVYTVTVPQGDHVIRGLFKKPTLAILSAAASVGANDPIAAGSMVYESCKLAADVEMDTDEEVRLAAIKSVQGLFQQLTAEVGEA